ncbi:hypothetical protein ACFXAZ_27850 [Streptomyces sp. NPDC059477]|uniref:hypothetical protein n=1 Tax=Streptomyces sp. NPDC059477 TaxID=3346847 RepID=UPI0036BB8814
MQLPDGIRKSANVLLCLVAVAGIGFSGREIWQNLHSRWQIDAGCGGLVPAGRVLALDRAGGEIIHRRGDAGTIELDGLPEGAEQCDLFSEEAGGRWFFIGAVGVHPMEAPLVTDDQMLPPVDQFDSRTYPAQPLGGGITGSLDDQGVGVETPCTGGEVAGEPVKALWAWAGLEPPSIFTDWGQPGDDDRDVLAEIAVITANNLAERLGCAERLPDPPADLPALPEGPVPVGRAEGTCAWYRESGLAARVGFPDEVLEGRVDDTLSDEACALVVSRGEAQATYRALREERDLISSPDLPGQWFVTLHTYRGERAKNVSAAGGSGDDIPARPGTAGRTPGNTVWWASSQCDGTPQLHTMTIGHGYDRVVAADAEDLFRAYVTEITDRRDCTDLAFPESDSFSRPQD